MFEFIIVVTVLFLMNACFIHSTKFIEIITINRKFQHFYSNKHNGNTLYLISDTNGNIYSIGKKYYLIHDIELWNSLNENESYEVIGYGIRNTVTDTFPYIVSAKKVI